MSYTYLENSNSNVFLGGRNLVSNNCLMSDMYCQSLDELLEKYNGSWSMVKANYTTKEALQHILEFNNTIT